MKGFEKFLLIIFSIIVIALAICVLLISTGAIDLKTIFNYINTWLVDNKTIGVVIGAIAALLGLVGLFSSSENPEDKKGGLAIKNEKGTVYITRDTFENIILSVTRGYAELKNVKSDVSMSNDGIVANVYAYILPDTVVPTLTAKLQEHIKASILKQTTVEIKEVNVKIRGVYIEPQKK